VARIITIRESPYYGQKDEDSFFERLRRIPSVTDVIGASRGLDIVFLDQSPDVDDIADLIGLFRRYRIDIGTIEKFLQENAIGWDSDKKWEWHKEAFRMLRHN